MGKLAIETRGLKKSFGKTHAVAGVDLAVSAGGVYGVLGPNGAGKTTTIRMLATLLRPDAGEAQVLGYDVVRDAQAVEQGGPHRAVRVGRRRPHRGGEPVAARQAARPHAAEAGAGGRPARRVRSCRGGRPAGEEVLRRDAQAHRHRGEPGRHPELIFLDEPTTGLDPRSRNQVWEIVRGMVAEGATVLLTTQYLDEADQLADRIAVIDHGRSSPRARAASSRHRSAPARCTHGYVRPSSGPRQSGSSAFEVPAEPSADPAALSARISDPERVARSLAELSRSGIDVAEFALGQPSLDEAFLALTGHAAEETPEDAA